MPDGTVFKCSWTPKRTSAGASSPSTWKDRSTSEGHVGPWKRQSGDRCFGCRPRRFFGTGSLFRVEERLDRFHQNDGARDGAEGRDPHLCVPTGKRYADAEGLPGRG